MLRAVPTTRRVLMQALRAVLVRTQGPQRAERIRPEQRGTGRLHPSRLTEAPFSLVSFAHRSNMHTFSQLRASTGLWQC
jgi:hypothetical protein